MYLEIEQQLENALLASPLISTNARVAAIGEEWEKSERATQIFSHIWINLVSDETPPRKSQPLSGPHTSKGTLTYYVTVAGQGLRTHQHLYPLVEEARVVLDGLNILMPGIGGEPDKPTDLEVADIRLVKYSEDRQTWDYRLTCVISYIRRTQGFTC